MREDKTEIIETTLKLDAANRLNLGTVLCKKISRDIGELFSIIVDNERGVISFETYRFTNGHFSFRGPKPRIQIPIEVVRALGLPKRNTTQQVSAIYHAAKNQPKLEIFLSGNIIN